MATKRKRRGSTEPDRYELASKAIFHVLLACNLTDVDANRALLKAGTEYLLFKHGQ